MTKKKGDYIKIKILRKDGVVQSSWVTPKTLKTKEAVFMRYKHHNITAFVPFIKISKKQPVVSFRPLVGKDTKKITLHIKIKYNTDTAGKYLASSREFYLDGRITFECLADEISKKIPKMEHILKNKIGAEFFSLDSHKNLLKNPYYGVDEDYESGVEIVDTPGSPSRSIDVDVDYRYSSNGLLKTMTL
jgi:hypothetical protein